MSCRKPIPASSLSRWCLLQRRQRREYIGHVEDRRQGALRARDTVGHWVDSFHSYGTGDDMGPLVSRDLPDFLAPADWNLRRSESEDVSGQVPSPGTWNVEGGDFWNGCVMARWGAYWDPAARPVFWDSGDPDNWPASCGPLFVSPWRFGILGADPAFRLVKVRGVGQVAIGEFGSACAAKSRRDSSLPTPDVFFSNDDRVGRGTSGVKSEQQVR